MGTSVSAEACIAKLETSSFKPSAGVHPGLPSFAHPVHVPRSVVLQLLLSAAAASCGGDSGSSGTTAPDNTPVAIAITPGPALTAASGTTTTFSASATARDGHAITGASIAWTSSDPAVATMSGAQLTALRAGTSTITATSGSASATVSVTVTPGAVRQIVVRTQPAGASLGALLATQPVLELQDAAGNVVTSSTTFVTAAIATGGGTLGGTLTVAAASGVVTFTDLRISGVAGTRTLGFTAGTLSAISAPITITPPPTPLLGVDSATVSFSVQRGSNPAARTVGITNLGSQPLTGLTVDVAYDAGQPLGWLSPTLSTPDAPSTLTLAVNTAALVEGTYHAVVHVNGPGAPNSPASIGVTLTVTAGYTVAYGTSADKMKIVDIGGTFAPTISIADLAGNPVPGISLTFTSRASTVATVAADGRITAVGGGDAWIVASTPAVSDSVFVIVPRSPSAPLMRTDATTFASRVGDTLTIDIVFDPRSTVVGAASLAVDLSLEAGSITYLYNIPSGTPPPIVNIPAAGLWRISVASANGITSSVPVLNLKIIGRTAGTRGWLTLYALDVSGIDGTNLTAQASSIRLPLVIR